MSEIFLRIIVNHTLNQIPSIFIYSRKVAPTQYTMRQYEE